MKRRFMGIALTALLVLIGAVQATHALASVTAISYNNASAQAITAGNWKVVAAADTVTSTAAAYIATSANFTSYTGSCGIQSLAATFVSAASTATMASTATLVTGMTITGTGIRTGAATTITVTNATTLTLSRTTNAVSSGSYTFTDTTCRQEFFSVNNFGTITATTIGIGQTVTATLGNSVELESCSTTWNETTGACTAAGTINIFLTTRGVSPTGYNPNSGLSIASGGTKRIRAITTQTGIQSTITVVINSASNVVAVPNLNA